MSQRFSGLHVLVDDDARWDRDPVEQARAASGGGPSVIQLRAKRASDREALAWARAIRAIAHDCGARFVVNDRFDLALASEADGVHLGQDDLPPGRIPESARARLAVGLSTHDLDQAKRACEEPIDYLAFGPLFETGSKESEYGERGLPLLQAVASAVAPLPVVAIGGIDAGAAPAVRAAGAAGFAVISAVAGAREPAAATRALVRAWDEAAPP